MKITESQKRELIEDSPYEFIQSQDMGKTVLLFNTITKKYEQWVSNDDFDGYVVVICGRGFEFVKSL